LKKILKYKIFVTCDDSPEMAKYSSKLKVFFRNLTIRNVDGLIVVHPDVAEFLAHNYRKTKCRFIFFPIIQNDEILVSRMKNAKIISENWIIDNNLLGKKIVLYVGRLAKEKAVDVLIKALYEVLKVESNTVLIIVGDGEEKIVLEELVDTLNLNEHVLFKGKLIGNPLYAWYNLAQIFVLPSIFEPFGAVVNEALVAGCYTIVSDKVGARCLINTKNGLIFNANNIKQLSDGIINFVTKIKPITNIVESENQMDKNFQFYYHNLIDFITFDHEN
jgi:glycosyltransferase involved in cell wall biosynthesis